MVSFICDACGNTVKKNQVEKHYQTACRNCSVLSCIDCGVDFPGDAYVSHTSCISEAEKYQGHLYQPKDKENKGESKQKQWIQQLQGASSSVKDPKLRSLLEKLSEYSNIPRKRKKFENFCKNSVKVYDTKTLDALWDAFNEGSNTKTPATNGNTQNGHSNTTDVNTNGTTNNNKADSEDENKVTESKKKKKKRKLEEDEEKDQDKQKNKKKKKKIADQEEIEEVQGEEKDENDNQHKGKFHWHKAIKTALKESDDHELPLKKLRKKVIAAYEAHGTDHRASNLQECRTLFEKKLNTYPKAKIIKDKYVKLCT
ncbi:cell growth-regulating nucleolar protein-like isoform X1 [Clytia hemisphaerica]|uniref:Zinc finger C2H2 LYAR-type domain-containing protein n=1 Tax=Clytia hemisphaerica TaxID=252671 RepID=A0A7M6DP87_9CNID